MKKILITTIFLFITIFPIFAEYPMYTESTVPLESESPSVLFYFQQYEDDRFRILSTVDEYAYFNKNLDHTSQIINRSTVHIIENNNDVAHIKASFMTAEEGTTTDSKTTFTISEQYECEFYRDSQGLYYIDDKSYMPSIRNVPYFLEDYVAPGTEWLGEGIEVHDLRQLFGIEKPFAVPFTATYKYLGKLKDSNLYVISVKYNYSFKPPVENPKVAEYPVKMYGYSNELIYWDAEKGSIHHYTETFRINVDTNFNNKMEFRGKAVGEVKDYERTATPENIENAKQVIENLGLSNVDVKEDENGLMLSIESINFKPDSAILDEKEKQKIKQLSEILKQFPDNDILVTGHTALVGSEESCLELSKQRAESVCQYLIELGVRTKYQIYTKGVGASVPLATNDTVEGRSKNRRVEITILDK